MKIVEFDPSQFAEGVKGEKKFREWLKGLTRVQLLELYDMDGLSDIEWEYFFEERDSREWPIGKDFRKKYLSMLFKDFNISGSKAEGRSFEAILDRLEPQVAGIQKKLDRILNIIGHKSVKLKMKDLLRF